MPSVTSMWQPGLSDGDKARVEALWQSDDEVDEWHLADDDDSQLDSLSAAPRAKPSSTRQRTLSRVAQRSALRNTFALRKPRRIRTPSGDERHRRIVVCRPARLRLEGKPKAALQQSCNSLNSQETRVCPQRVKEAQPAVPVASEASLAAPCIPPPAARSRLCLRGRNKEEALTRRRHAPHTGLAPPLPAAAEAERVGAKPPYGYTGHRFESELGLTDAGGRFYDAKFGIFLSPDPIGPLNGGSTFGNRYAYVGYDPINFVDPTGFQAEELNGQEYPPEARDCLSHPNMSHCSEGDNSGVIGLVATGATLTAGAVAGCYNDPSCAKGVKGVVKSIGKEIKGWGNSISEWGIWDGNFGGSSSKPKPSISTTDGQMFGVAGPTDLSSGGRADGANFYDPDTGEWLNVGPLDSSEDGVAPPAGNMQIMHDPNFKGDPNQADFWDSHAGWLAVVTPGPGYGAALFSRLLSKLAPWAARGAPALAPSALQGARLNMQLAAEQTAGAVLPEAIKGFTRHGLNQAISRDGVGVATRAIADAFKNPISIVGQSGGRFVFTGQNAAVVLNAEGRVISTWATNSAGVRAVVP